MCATIRNDNHSGRIPINVSRSMICGMNRFPRYFHGSSYFGQC